MQLVKSKWLKILFVLLLLAIGLLITGEMSIKQLETSMPYASVYLKWDEFGHTLDELEEFQRLFREKDVELLAEIRVYDSEAGVRYHHMYGSKLAIESFQRDTALEERRYSSLFDWDIQYCFHDFSQLVYADCDYFDIHLISEDDLRHTLPADWVLELGINDISGQNTNVRIQHERMIYGIWAIVFIATLVFIYYDCLKQKKQFFVQVAFGDSLSHLIRMNILFDSCVYGLFFIGISIVTSKWISLPYGGRTFLVIGMLFLLGNALTYLPLLRYSFREALSGTTLSQKELLLSYVLHIGILVTTIILLCLNTEWTDRYFEYKKQGDFYESHQDMYTISAYPDGDNEMYLLDCYYLEHLDTGEVHRFDYISTWYDAQNQPFSYIEMNKNTVDWLKEQIPEIRHYDLHVGNKIYLYPDTFELGDKDFFSKSGGLYLEGVTEEIQVVAYCYPSGFQMPSIDGNDFAGKLMWHTDPIIAIDMRSDLSEVIPYLDVSIGSGNFSAYIFSLEAPDNSQIVLCDGTVVSCMSIYEAYEQQLMEYWRECMWESCILLLVFLLEISVVIRIIQLEFETNAKKYILMRLFGEGVLETYHLIWNTTIILYGVGYAVSAYVLQKLNISDISKKTWIALACLLTCETLLIFAYILRMENVAKQKVLKGGSL